MTIFKLTQAIVRTNVLIKKNATPPCGHVFKRTSTIFHLSPDIISTNILTNVITRKTGPPPGSHVFQQTRTIFKLIRDMFHEDWTMNLTSTVHNWKTAPPPGGHVFLPTGTNFELVKDFIGTHVPTKFHDDWTKNVTSRVLTRKTATPPGTQFHEDWKKNVNVDAARQTTHKRRSQKLTMSTFCSSSHCVNTFFVTVNGGGVVVVHFQDMAPDTKVPDGQLDGRTTPKQYPSASGG
ncbi:hypothetical protein DPMN_147379 [Dreissena polymorpha]|uniref:Uncharacterized protein n=1 Tax=Dreissena polymorpha TaxID=45954 RepID=A0A9D4F8Y1_DREPO|nr:hypothetical protein DPMN_147379 [Dreissena polymorpha]